MPRWPLLLALLLAIAADAATVHNDDSCDIAVLPAATLLLPYFEVDLDDDRGETTLFTVTNVTNVDQIVQVTLWTDRSFPVIDFNIYLTGYDVQAINLFDVISRGVIAPDAGTGTVISKRGRFSDRNTAVDLVNCGVLPGLLDEAYVERMQDAFTGGFVEDLGTIKGCDRVGSEHDHAVGYVTVDVVRACWYASPSDAEYWTKVIAYDNALIGDYLQVNSREDIAQGGPMVHIRAVPEGGTPESRARVDPGFQKTFYGHLQDPATPKRDGRQPLPSQFAARWIADDEELETSLKIWRTGETRRGAPCTDYAAGGELPVTDIVAFDDSENAAGISRSRTRVSSLSDVTDPDIYPVPPNGAKGGWMYLNTGDQAWVISSMRAYGRYAVDMDAVAFGNGCSATARPSEVTVAGGAPIVPAPNMRSASSGSRTNNDDSCDIALLPAATLLLPYFEVDIENRREQTTLFTVTNVSPLDQIARVTLWTDYAIPVMTFNIYLTGYDMQSIDLYDVLARGVIGGEEGTGLLASDRGPYSERNESLDLTDCRRLAGALPDEYLLLADQAFRSGMDITACNNVGNEHENAVGYATIDVVRNCAVNQPTSREYWTEDVAYDNVLIGDYQQIVSWNDSAQGTPMVHIRAIPEGGTPLERRDAPRQFDAGFARTFYARYQPPGSAKLDGRQPLPSTFAARWIQGGTSEFQTSMKIWREGTGSTRMCPQFDDTGVTEVTEVIRFDESETAVGLQRRRYDQSGFVIRGNMPFPQETYLPATSLTSVADDDVYPQLTNGAIAGWIYLNLDNGAFEDGASQSWVTISMRAEGRYAVDLDAAPLGNGCSAPAAESEVNESGGAIIGPAANRSNQ